VRHDGWSVHFHAHLVQHYNFGWVYTWSKTQLHTSGLVERAKRRGAHRRKRPRKPCVGMMLHEDAGRFAWLAGEAPLDLVATMDDATSRVYSAFLVEEDGTASSFRGLQETLSAQGQASSLWDCQEFCARSRVSHCHSPPSSGASATADCMCSCATRDMS